MNVAYHSMWRRQKIGIRVVGENFSPQRTHSVVVCGGEMEERNTF